MVNRQEDQGQASIDAIKKEAGDKAQVEWFSCDLANLQQIRETFNKFYEREDRLDLVCLSVAPLAARRSLI